MTVILFKLLQMLVQEIIKEEKFSVESHKQGKRASEILQRMAARKALIHITNPVQWHQMLRENIQY